MKTIEEKPEWEYEWVLDLSRRLQMHFIKSNLTEQQRYEMENICIGILKSLLDQQRKRFLEIIGEDEETQVVVKDSHYKSGYRTKSIGQAYTRNKLRAELRNKIKEKI